MQTRSLHFPFIVCIALYANMHAAWGREYIQSFDTTIVVNQDDSLTITEHITCMVTNQQIKHGIFRTIPLQLPLWSYLFNTSFILQKVTHNGRETPYTLDVTPNSASIKIGTKNKTVAPGLHTYTLHYTMSKQIEFFKNHDELYWNITGNEWQFPIASTQATIILPKDVPTKSIKALAYTGKKGSRESNATIHINQTTIEIQTTKHLNVHEGLTIVVGWQPGFITRPSWWYRMAMVCMYYCFHVLIILAALWYVLRKVWKWYKRKKIRDAIPIIPLFYPPDNLLPGEMVYINTQKEKNSIGLAMASDIINMAVLGYISIEYTEKITRHVYTLHKKERPPHNTLYETLYNTFFVHGPTYTIDSDKTVTKVIEQAEEHYKKSGDSYFLPTPMPQVHRIIILICVFIILALTSTPLFVGLFLVIINIPNLLPKQYTAAGNKLYQAIQGFKLFLSTTETDRLAVIGTPPTRTPELYEKYLPYAVALGVEKAWTQQFVPIFNQLSHPYRPVWYYSSRPLQFNSFAQSLSYDLTQSLSYNYQSSGFSTKGSSGGGKGGGGGGGW